MTEERGNGFGTELLEQLRGVYDGLSVRRVFGDPYELGGVTIIPVARVAGGAGGGGSDGSDAPDGQAPGSGTGFGLVAQPLGVFEVRDGVAVWKPAVDVTRIARGAQVVGAVIAVCITLVVLRRRREATGHASKVAPTSTGEPGPRS